MPVRITILSGSRQGEILETDQSLIAVGDLPTDDIAFDSLQDTELRDRRASLKLEGGRWRIHNAGAKSIFVNQDVVTSTKTLHSGDIVRMSHDGPDFSFDLISSLSKSNAPQSRSPAAKSLPSNAQAVADSTSMVKSNRSPASKASQTRRAEQPQSDVDSIPQSAWPFDWRAMIGGSLVLLATLSAWAVWPNQQPRFDPPRLGSFPVLDFNEGENVLWKPPLISSTTEKRTLRYKFVGDVPTGMTIDASTGLINWKTAEGHGPKHYRCSVMVFDDEAGEAVSDTGVLEIQIKEVNQPPVNARLATQEVDLSNDHELRVQLRAEDPDEPPQKLSFHLGAEAPEGVSLDPATGHLVWEVGSEFANQVVTIPYRVTDDATDPRSASGIVRVRITLPDRWTIVEQELRECVYLLVAQTDPGDSILPLGTVCAIEPHTLLTSATVASGANDAATRGWKILAVDTGNFRLEDPQGFEVTEIRSHAGYVHASDPVEQAYFDLALLTTNSELPKFCKLGDVEASATNGQALGCFGYELHRGSLTRFDSPRPILAKTMLLEVIPPPSPATIPGRQPYLLQLIGELPFQPFGSLIINDDAELLGIYAFRGNLPENAPPTPIHYAPDIFLASAYLAEQGKSLWVSPDDPLGPGKDDPQ